VQDDEGGKQLGEGVFGEFCGFGGSTDSAKTLHSLCASLYWHAWFAVHGQPRKHESTLRVEFRFFVFSWRHRIMESPAFRSSRT
jgi:hypothetical protein